MIIVDSHCHISREWFEPVESLLFQMDRNDVDSAVLIQVFADQNNEYLFECVRRYPGRFMPVVRVNESSPSILDDLSRWKDRGASGVRLSPLTSSQGSDPYAIWRKAEELKLPVSCLGKTMSEFTTGNLAKVLQEVPGLPVVIEHMGTLNVPVQGEAAPYEERRKVFDLARYPNAYVKFHGYGEFTPRTYPTPPGESFPSEVPPLQEMAYEAFGSERMMWGSDYPPVAGREGYRNALRVPMRRFGGKPAEALAMIFGGTALKVFGPA